MNHITNAFYKVVFNQPRRGVKDAFGQPRMQTILKQCTAGEADYAVCQCGAVYPFAGYKFAGYKGVDCVGVSTLDCPVKEAMEQSPIQP